MLFLGAGSVITAMHHEQDMRHYGGLRHKIPRTFWAMVIGTLAITGVGIPLTHIGFAGFLSKDAIIESAWAGTNGAALFGFWSLVIAACFTSFYSWRLIFMTFFGEPKGDRHAYDHAHESPNTMLIPLGVLAVGSILSGMIWYNVFFGNHEAMNRWFGLPAPAAAEAAEPGAIEAATEGEAAHEAGVATLEEAPAAEPSHEGAPAEAHAAAEDHHGAVGAVFFGPDNHTIDEAHHAPAWVKVSPFLAMLIGLAVAYWFYIVNPEMPKALARNQPVLYRFLLNKWYFDELYDFLFVRPAVRVGTALWRGIDDWLIDKTVVEGLGARVVDITRRVVKLQSGYLYHYAFAMLIGVAALLTWAIAAGGLLG
jgi:NADH-quinone oxidoreductase subunit L